MKKIFIILCLITAPVLTKNLNLPVDGQEDWTMLNLDQIFDIHYNENRTEHLTESIQNNIQPTESKPKVNNFDWMILKAVVDQSEAKNVLISPLGIKTMLTILFELSDEGTPTQRQLEKVNPKGNWFLTGAELREPYEKRIASLQKNAFSYNVDFGTRIFVDEKVEPKQRSTELVTKYYRGAFEQVRFQDTADIIKRFNDWGSHSTQKKITNIVDTDSLPPTSLVALANIAHFQALWDQSFNESFTSKFISSNELLDASYMRSINRFYYLDSEELGAKLIRLPYAGRKFAMFIALPQKKNGLTQLIEDFNKIDLNVVLREMDATTVSVLIPQFQLDYKVNLNEAICSLEINRIFYANASFSALAVPNDTENFPDGAPITGVFHAASIVVDNKSATDTISTSSDFGGSEIDLKIQKFEAAWPFLFFILDETTGGILFSGTVRKPKINE